MAHLPDLIYDLALMLLVGSFAALIFKIIKQPLVLGYIIAGFLVGQHFDFLPSIKDQSNVATLSELGVIFLLFSLGLEFSFKKLVRVGPTASITAVIEIIFVGIAGYLVGLMLGWSTMDSLFLGGMLASSSTTIILRAFDELNVKTKQFARIVFGVLVVEDIIVILLMVLLSTIAVTNKFEGTEILFTVAKLGFFMVLWFLVGIYLLPTFFRKARKWLDEETTLILAIGLCLGMVIIATQVGFSAELGAFVMGSLIAETTKAEKIEHITLPIKTLFGTIFFVSVGLKIDPNAMMEYAFPIFVVTMLVIVGKFLFSVVGVVLSGQSLRQGVRVGMSMAQIGEFAFIVATLGLSLGVISEFLFPIAVGVSAITTFTTPYLIRWADPFYSWIEKNLPSKWINTIEAYALNASKASAEADWQVILKSHLKLISINIILFIAILLAFAYIVEPIILTAISHNALAMYGVLAVAILVSSPFLWAILIQKPSLDGVEWSRQSKKRQHTGVMVARTIVTAVLIGILAHRLAPHTIGSLLAIPLTIIALYSFSGWFEKMYQYFSNTFFDNLNARERNARIKDAPTILDTENVETITRNLEAWDAHIVELEVPAMAEYAGEKIGHLEWRRLYDLNIVYIRRGENMISLPGPQEQILPYDKVGFVGTDEQMQRFKPVFDKTIEVTSDEQTEEKNIVLRNIKVTSSCSFVNQPILESRIRQEAGCQIIGVERNNERFVNPSASFVLQEDDLIWVVGDEADINKFFKGRIK